MERATLEQLNRYHRARRAAVLVADLTDGVASVVAEGEPLPGGDCSFAIAEVFRSGRSGITETARARYFLNVHLPPPRLVIIGAVHISQGLARMASLAGFDVRIIDPRTAFATPERFGRIKLTADWPTDALTGDPLDAHTALVAVTHDPKIDDFPIAEAVRRGCFYIGALGSRKTHGSCLERLKADGFSDADLMHIHGPIGLNIRAIGPAELAVTILAQIVEALRSRDVAIRKDGRP